MVDIWRKLTTGTQIQVLIFPLVGLNPSAHNTIPMLYGFLFPTSLIIQRSETERTYTKRTSKASLFEINAFSSQNKKAQDLPKINESSTLMKTVNSTRFRQLRKQNWEGVPTSVEISRILLLERAFLSCFKVDDFVD